jgi:hypothetical protein
VHFVHSPLYGPYWSVTQYRDIMTVDTSHQVLLVRRRVGGHHAERCPVGVQEGSFIVMDPPRHDEQRKIVSPICRVVDKKRLAPIWLRARPDTAPRFCGLEIGNAVPHHRLRGIPKGGRTASRTPRRPRPSASRADWAVRLALQAVENRVYLSEPVLRVSVSLYTNPPSAGPEVVRRVSRSLERLSRTVAIGTVRVPVSMQISDPQNYGAVGKTLLATTL